LSAASAAHCALGAVAFLTPIETHPIAGPSIARGRRAVAADEFALASPIPRETTMTTETKSTQIERIRNLNDELRHNLSHAHAFMTPGVAALGPEAVVRILKTIEVYDDFCHANDPYEEHDFGSFEADGHTIFFKIDYFDPRPCIPPIRLTQSSPSA
jgi:hypothetical protein